MTGRNYAILSHTWEKNEVTFDQYQPSEVSRNRLPGYDKIKKACVQARSKPYNLKYIWIDTCCIDKRSSSELSEAINSMWHWYALSTLCIAYLADVPMSELAYRFPRSRWFTRGWTLQELIAPSDVTLFSKEWRPLGTKDSLRRDLSDAAGIPPQHLDAASALTCSTYEKMSFAAARTTTRVEDMAYCLLGLFGLTMPLLYGEGVRAFARLQAEIVQRTHDASFLAWVDLRDRARRPTSSFAPNAAVYSPLAHVRSTSEGDRRPYELTNVGLHIFLPVVRSVVAGLFYAVVGKTVEGRNTVYVAIPIRRRHLLGVKERVGAEMEECVEHYRADCSVIALSPRQMKEAENVCFYLN